MTPLSLAATAMTPGTSLASVARRSTASIWRDWAAPPCAAACRTTAPTEALAVSAAAVLRNSRRVCGLIIVAFPFKFLPAARRGVLGQLRGDVGKGDFERCPDVDHARLARGECLLQCGLQRRRFLDPNPAAAPRSGDRGLIPVFELGGKGPRAVQYPAERVVVEHHGDDRDVLLDRGHQPVHRHC